MTTEAAGPPPLWRYPGPGPFRDTPQDRALFFGRGDETGSMTSLFIASRLVVLFGRSGLGKTSLLNAGVFPRLREEAFLPFRVTVKPGIRPAPLVADALRAAAGAFATDASIPEAGTLWELFKTATIWRNDVLLTPVLVFDQFEECFTLLSADERMALSDELGHLVSQTVPADARQRQLMLPPEERVKESAPIVKVILSLREEYLAGLEDLTPHLPLLFQDRFRLLPLPAAQARKAIEEPAHLATSGVPEAPRFAIAPFSFQPRTIELMLDFLGDRSGKVEPWALQILCRHLERQVVRALREAGARPEPIAIGPEDLGGKEAMRRILRSFFDEEISKVEGPQQKRARELCDTGLISQEGRRLSLEANQIRSDWKVTSETLKQLEESRVLRREDRLDSTYYEISHDKLAEIIREGRKFRLPRRLRMAAWVFGAMTLLVLSVGTIFNLRLRHERDTATDARARTENLVAFLIGEDLLEELNRTGQLALLDVVQREVDSYVKNIAGEAGTRGGDIARALALANRGQLQYQRGDLKHGAPSFAEALEVFEKLARDQPWEPVVAAGFAGTLENAAKLAYEQGQLDKALSFAERAIAVRAEIAAGPGSGERSVRRLAHARLLAAELMARRGRMGDADKQLVEVFHIIDGQPDAVRSDPQWRYVVADAHERRGDLAERRKDYAEAEKEYRAEIAEAEKLKESLPFEPEAQRTYAMAQFWLARLAPDEVSQAGPGSHGEESRGFDKQRSTSADAPLRPKASAEAARSPTPTAAATRRPEEVQLKVYEDLQTTLKAMNRWEGQNALWTRELWATGFLVGWAKVQTGQRVEGLRSYQASLDKFEEQVKADPTNAARREDTLWGHQEMASFQTGREAIDNLRRAAEIADELLETNPVDRDLQYRRIDLLLALASELRGSGQPKESTEVLQRARSLLKTMSAGDATSWDYLDRALTLHSRDKEGSERPEDKRAACEAALALLADAIKREPNKPYAQGLYGSELRALGSLQLNAKELTAAEATFNRSKEALTRALKLGRNADLWWYWNELFLTHYDGFAQLAREKHDGRSALRADREALKAIEEAIKLRPDDLVFRTSKALAENSIGNELRDATPHDFDGAENAYARAAEVLRAVLAAGTSKSKVDEAGAKSEAKRWNQLFTLELVGRSELYDRKGNNDRALRAARDATTAIASAVALEPDNAGYLNALGRAHKAIARLLVRGEAGKLPEIEAELDRARDAYRASIKKAPAQVGGWNGLFLLYYEGFTTLRTLQKRPDAVTEEYRNALVAAEKAAPLAPKDAVSYYNVHLAHDQVADGLSKDPAASAEKEDHLKRSLAAIERAVALSPQAADYRAALARALVHAGKREESSGSHSLRNFNRAVVESQMAVKLAGTSAVNRNLVALTELEHGTRLANEPEKAGAAKKALEDASDAAERAVKMDATNLIYQRNLSEAQFALSKFPSTEKAQGPSHLRRAVDAALESARLAEATGQYPEAYKSFRRAYDFERALTAADAPEVARTLLAIERTVTHAGENSPPNPEQDARTAHDWAISMLRRLKAEGPLPPDLQTALDRESSAAGDPAVSGSSR
jgi:hypothetical protein